MEPYLASIIGFAGNFAPRNWALCNGQALAISTNQALFSVFGTTYGGNGVTTFNLPDLRGRSIISSGQGPGLQNYTMGQAAGTESATLSLGQIPAHVHNGNVNLALAANSNDGIDPTSNDGYPSAYTGAYSATGGGNMGVVGYEETIGNTGGNQPIDIRSPFLVITYIIALTGVYPSRN